MKVAGKVLALAPEMDRLLAYASDAFAAYKASLPPPCVRLTVKRKFRLNQQWLKTHNDVVMMFNKLKKEVFDQACAETAEWAIQQAGGNPKVAPI